MFTANIAGSSGSHLRTDHPHRDSNSHSRHNLHEIDRASMTEEEKRILNANSHQRGGEGGDAVDGEPIDPERLQELINEHRRRRFMRDYKTWGYLACVAVVVIAAIVLIILAASGVISTDDS